MPSQQVIESETHPTIERRAVCRPAWYDEAINRLVVAAIRQAIIDVQRPVSDKDIPDAAEFLRCEALLWLDAVVPDNGIDPEIWREWVNRGCPLAGGKLGLQTVFTGEDA